MSKLSLAAPAPEHLRFNSVVFDHEGIVKALRGLFEAEENDPVESEDDPKAWLYHKTRWALLEELEECHATLKGCEGAIAAFGRPKGDARTPRG
jgi:hypothetical protein